MNRTPAALALMLIASCATAQTSSSSTTSSVLRVIPQGSDGTSHFYNVQCVDKRYTSITVRDATNETCVQPTGKAKQCQVNWRLRDAAQAACTS